VNFVDDQRFYATISTAGHVPAAGSGALSC
jgi:hypothetical protein